VAVPAGTSPGRAGSGRRADDFALAGVD